MKRVGPPSFWSLWADLLPRFPGGWKPRHWSHFWGTVCTGLRSRVASLPNLFIYAWAGFFSLVGPVPAFPNVAFRGTP